MRRKLLASIAVSFACGFAVCWVYRDSEAAKPPAAVPRVNRVTIVREGVHTDYVVRSGLSHDKVTGQVEEWGEQSGQSDTMIVLLADETQVTMSAVPVK